MPVLLIFLGPMESVRKEIFSKLQESHELSCSPNITTSCTSSSFVGSTYDEQAPLSLFQSQLFPWARNESSPFRMFNFVPPLEPN